MVPEEFQELIGSAVELHSLQAKPELNGSSGVIVGSAIISSPFKTFFMPSLSLFPSTLHIFHFNFSLQFVYFTFAITLPGGVLVYFSLP